MKILHPRLVSTAAKTYKPIPHPSFIELIRNGLPLWNYENNIVPFLHSAKETYGDIFKFKIPMGPYGVFLFNPRDVEVALRSAGKWPNRPGFHALGQFRSERELYANSAGLISSQGQEWYDFRSKVQTALLKPKVIQAYHERIDSVAQDFIEGVFKDSLEDGYATSELIEHLYKWGLESTGVLAFDRRLGVLNPPERSNPEAQEFINHVQRVFALTHQLERNFIWRYIGVLYPKFKEMMMRLERMEELAIKYTNQKITSIDNKTDQGSNSSVIENLYKAGCSRNILCTLAMDMLMAGIDTAANQTTFTLYYIAQNEDVQEKLYNEIKRLNIEDPSFVESAAYLRATLKEVLRMQPTVIGNARMCDTPIELDDYIIEKGTLISTCHIVMCHDPRFVNEPSQFRPERYIKGHSLYERIQPFTSLPFGHGPRVCVGKRFANLEMCLLLARIISKYRLEKTNGSLNITVPLLMKPEGAIPVRFVPRDG